MIQFNAKYLKHLVPFMGSADIRFYLNAVHIAPHDDGGAVLVACNGHTMMCIRDIKAICDAPANIALNREAAKHGTHRPNQPDALVSINTVTQRLTISDGQTGDELYLQPGKCLLADDGSDRPNGYVDWKKVLPDFEKLVPGAGDPIQVKYHELAAKAHPTYGRNHLPAAIRFWQVERNGTLIVEFCGAPEFMLLIMPFRAHAEADTAPQLWQAAFGRKPEPVSIADITSTARASPLEPT